MTEIQLIFNSKPPPPQAALSDYTNLRQFLPSLGAHVDCTTFSEFVLTVLYHYHIAVLMWALLRQGLYLKFLVISSS